MTHIQQRLVDHHSVEDALADLCGGLCPSDGACHFCEPVRASDMPKPFSELLVHNDHMTTRLRDHHRRPVELRVLDEVHEDPIYRRKIVLTLAGTDRVVEFGVVRIDFRLMLPATRAEILSHRRPLGDILIRSNLFRQIEPRWYVKLSARCPTLADFCDAGLEQVYGRVGTIYCDGDPAVEMLEVITAVGDNPVHEEEGGSNV